MTSTLDPQIAAAVIGALISSLVTFFVAHRFGEGGTLRKALAKANTDLNEVRIQVRDLASTIESTREKLRESFVVHSYHLPVILVGPRYVGKSSLVRCWHAPWETTSMSPTATHRASEVPLYNFHPSDLVPHFADAKVMVKSHQHLLLRVHDFPGELTAQKAIRETAISETEKLQSETGKALGIGLVCMFDAEEAATGVSSDTRSYYNGDLFRELRLLITHGKLTVQRLVLVFNKFDCLRRHYPDTKAMPDDQLVRRALDKLSTVYEPLRGICNVEKVCEVATVLSHDHTILSGGSSLVRGELARDFVAQMAGTRVAVELFPDYASNQVGTKLFG